MSTGYPDTPVLTLNDDLFGVKQYVDALVKFILECDTPMTISIQGDWGSGKTSMMNMIQEKLGDKVLPIWFNTWQFSQFNLGNTLAISMIEVLLQALEGDTKILDKIASSTAGLFKQLLISVTELSGGSNIANKVESAVDNLTAKSCVEEIRELKDAFQKAVKNKIEKSKRTRIVIFVDDLDRLEPAKAVELLEVLKLFLDCEQCLFVLAVDYEIVTLGIRQKYGESIAAAKGKSFFEKIIQLPFKMPVVRYDVKKYTKSMMKNMSIATAEDNVKLFSSLIKNSVGVNPRGIKRLFNTYQLLYNVIQSGNSKDELRKQKNLFAAVCMQMSFESVYNYLAAGNMDTDTLKKLFAVDNKAIRNFMRQRSMDNDESDEGNILEVLFDEKISSEELKTILQKLPTFLKYFADAIHTDQGKEISEEEIAYLRDILKSSAITSVKSDSGDLAYQQATEQRQINHELVRQVNEKLKENTGEEFKIAQAKPTENGIVLTTVAGYIFIAGKNFKKCQLRYVVDYEEKTGRALSIYLGANDWDLEEFKVIMGKNPLGDKKSPDTTSKQGWYFYDELLAVNDSNTLASVVKITAKVEDAYRKVKKILE